jgi:Carboxypeptidase regulatory-like domain
LDLPMRRNQWLQYAATGIAGLGLVFPSGVMAAQPATPIAAGAVAASSIVDVRLNTSGMLVGQVVDAQGASMSQATVTLRGTSSEAFSTVTNAQGAFSLAGLHGGVYEASAGGGSTVLRVWTAEASPPSANKSVMIVSGGPVARGQFFNGPNRLGSIALFGVIVGGVTTAALITDSRNSGS